MSINLPRLPQTAPSHAEMQVWWQQVVEAIESHEDTQDEIISDLADAVADIVAAQAAADDAQADATAAARETARIISYVSPTSILSAADVGADATITIANHTRVYPVQGSVDVPDVSITGGTITGLAFATLYYVYYDDTTLADTTPNYVATTTAATAQVGAATGRHFLGSITTPADGAGGTTGGGGTPPGYHSNI